MDCYLADGFAQVIFQFIDVGSSKSRVRRPIDLETALVSWSPAFNPIKISQGMLIEC